MTTAVVVVPSSFGTWRRDLNKALLDMVAAFQAANPTIVRKSWQILPASIVGETPFTYIGTIHETVTHDIQTRTTVFVGTIGFVDQWSDPQQTNSRIDAFSDYFRDLCTENASMLPPAVFEETGFDELHDLSEGQGVAMAHVGVAWRFRVQEGYR